MVITNIDKQTKLIIIKSNKKEKNSMNLPCNNMNLNLYRVFYIVAKTKSFSESSKNLHISQPAISKNIKALEDELNTQLFFRTNRGIELTPAAKKLFTYIEKAYTYIALGEKELMETSNESKDTLTIGISSSISSHYLDEYIKEFIKLYPNIIIKIISREEPTLLELFEQNSINFLLSLGNMNFTKECQNINIYQEEYSFCFNPNSYNCSTSLNLEELRENNLILPSKKTKVRKLLDNYLIAKGINNNMTIEVDNSDMILKYTEEGLGLGYLPKSIIESNDNLQIIQLSERIIVENIILSYNEENSNTYTNDFIKIINERTE